MGRKNLLKDLLKVILATLLVFAIVEFLLRVVYFIRNSTVDYVVLPYTAAQDWGPIPPWIDGLRILERDETLFWRIRRNIEQSYMDVYSPVQFEEDRTTLLRQFFPTVPALLIDNPVWKVSTNSSGFRDKEFPNQKPPNIFRILCLGDSWTFGSNVDQEQAYPQRLGTILQRHFPRASFEVMNLGVLGYSSYQGLEVFKRTVIDLAPNLILIGFGMNDAKVAGWQDKEMSSFKEPLAKQFGRLLENAESYKLAKYLTQVIQYKSWSIGDYMGKLAHAVGTPAEAWAGREVSELFDPELLEEYARVSPKDYEKNIVQMIDLARRNGGDVILLYNELWDTPYRMVLKKVAKMQGVPLVDSKALIDRARTWIESDLEKQLDLHPPQTSLAGGSGEIEVIFRVSSGKYPVPKTLYMVGDHQKLGSLVPNQVAMFDDGTHGDQRAGDAVWSYAATFSPGTKLFYVYTNSGEEGQWEGLDVPHIRAFRVHALNGEATVYRPIESFGEIYMQADGWHTNAVGYELISKALLEEIKKDEKVKNYLGEFHYNRIER